MEERTLDEVWQFFYEEELRTMLFSFKTTATSLRESAKRDAKMRSIFDHGSPGDLLGANGDQDCWCERYRCAMLEKQYLYERTQGLIEQVSYLLEIPYRFDLWPSAEFTKSGSWEHRA